MRLVFGKEKVMPRILLLFLAVFVFVSFPILLSGCTGGDDYYDPEAEDDPGYGGSSSPASANPMGGGMPGVGVTPTGTQPPVQPGGFRTADGQMVGGANRGGELNRSDYKHFERGSKAFARADSLYRKYFRAKTDGGNVDMSMVEKALSLLDTALDEFEQIKSVRGTMKETLEDMKSDAQHLRSDLLRE